jgi:hypothetical protein
MRCPAHPDRVATVECLVCGRLHCGDCAQVHPGLGGPVCGACRPAAGAVTPTNASASPRTAARLGPAVALGLAAAASLLIVAMATRAPSRPDPGRLHAEALAALEAAGTAAERHRGAHQSWPARLEDLVPSQLSALPLDPYAPGRPLVLGRDPLRGEGRVIYSVGPDGIDQGGLPVDPVTGRGDMAYPLD